VILGLPRYKPARQGPSDPIALGQPEQGLPAAEPKERTAEHGAWGASEDAAHGSGRRLAPCEEGPVQG
jgi:hypothetical protein